MEANGDRTIVADPKWIGPVLLVAFPMLGAAAGWGLDLASDWIVDLSWFPFQGPVELFTRLPDLLRLTAATGLGAVAGLVLAFIAVADQLTMTVDSRRLGLERGDYRRTVEASDAAAVFVEDRQLVVLGRRHQELARIAFDLDRDKVATALRRHGYAWHPDGDPHEGEYRRWVPDSEGLPSGADPLLKTRQHALEKSKGDDLEELRAELAAIDVVVRDKDKKQYWRLCDPA
ncbi:hypothetical protein L0U85_09290 [Glycomyces sp. L485]|uniref:YqeB family protein n=1 Tax=Glycomyces sp. L485 TaxID=2909235 RepID=UPI001F4B5FA7|nr:hypothetical protein [Glycomyces sp. L485]MCH7231043.1 hypothetical protein [Glycomyces sp. L485]